MLSLAQACTHKEKGCLAQRKDRLHVQVAGNLKLKLNRETLHISAWSTSTKPRSESGCATYCVSIINVTMDEYVDNYGGKLYMLVIVKGR